MNKETKPEKGKELQRLTDIENLKTPKMVTEYLTSNPKDKKLVMDSLQERINQTYQKKEGKEFLLEELVVACQNFGSAVDLETDIRNTTYEVNHSLISNCLHNYIIKHRCFPAIQTIAIETGLSRNTVYKHLNDGLRNRYNGLVMGKLEYMTMTALSSLYLIGIEERNASALKSFIELAGNVKTSSQTINNFIQINNLKLSKDEVDRLPESVILEVEQLISKNLIR